MFNSIKNRLLPWQEKGRWYHALVESNGTNLHLTVCDLEGCGVSGTTFTMPKDFQLVDVKCIDLDLISGKSFAMFTKGCTSGKPTLSLPSAANFTYYEFYFFGYFKP